MKFHFGKLNWILFILGILFLLAGYIIMSTGDKTISPIMLVIAYVGLFPLSLLLGFKKDK